MGNEHGGETNRGETSHGETSQRGEREPGERELESANWLPMRSPSSIPSGLA